MKTKTRLRFADLPKEYASLCALLPPRTIHDAVDYANTAEVTDAMVLWVDEKQGEYGFEAETTGKTGDSKAERLTLDPTLQIAVLNLGKTVPTKFNNLPAIRFLADGTVDENSPQTIQLTDSGGVTRWLIESKSRTGYEVSNTKQ